MTKDFKTKKGRYTQPRLTPEEWGEKKRQEKDDLYHEIDDTTMSIMQDPEKFKGFLDTQSRVNRYSTANAMSIYKHCPNATKLREFDDWVSDNVKIKKGEKSLPILEPYEYTKKDGSSGIDYNIKKVFDVSQTTAHQQPAPSLNRDPQKLVAVLIDTAPVTVKSVDELPYPNMGAYYNNEEQNLLIKRGIGDSVGLFQCVAQELGHAQLSINSETYSRKDMGFQAVCIAYMLCRKFGVDTQNFAVDRIPDEWKNKEPKTIRAELTKSRNAMNEIYSRTSDELNRQKQERSQDKER